MNPQKSVSISADFADALASSGLFKKLGALKVADEAKRQHNKQPVKHRTSDPLLQDALQPPRALEQSVSQTLSKPPESSALGGTRELSDVEQQHTQQQQQQQQQQHVQPPVNGVSSPRQAAAPPLVTTAAAGSSGGGVSSAGHVSPRTTPSPPGNGRAPRDLSPIDSRVRQASSLPPSQQPQQQQPQSAAMAAVAPPVALPAAGASVTAASSSPAAAAAALVSSSSPSSASAAAAAVLVQGSSGTPVVTPPSAAAAPAAAEKPRGWHGSGRKSGTGTKGSVGAAVVPPTRIPEKYHRIERYPVLPVVGGGPSGGPAATGGGGAAAQQHHQQHHHHQQQQQAHAAGSVPGEELDDDSTVVFRDNAFYKTWFPSSRPVDRREVAQLAHTFDLMLRECDSLPPALRLEKEQKVYDIVLHELTRQVSVECADRGHLLDRLARRYVELFERVPRLLHELCLELDALLDSNRSLRAVLERLVADKSLTELSLADCRDQLARTQGEAATFFEQARDLATKLARCQDERDTAQLEARAREEAARVQGEQLRTVQAEYSQQQLQVKQLTEQLDDALSRLRDREREAELRALHERKDALARQHREQAGGMRSPFITEDAADLFRPDVDHQGVGGPLAP